MKWCLWMWRRKEDAVFLPNYYQIAIVARSIYKKAISNFCIWSRWLQSNVVTIEKPRMYPK